MPRRVSVVVASILMAAVVPVRAQFAVIDAANLAQAILIAQRTQRQVEQLQAEYRTILRMAQGLGDLNRYRIPAVALTSHEIDRWRYGRPWIQALNSGDPAGTAYRQTVLPLEAPDMAGVTLSPAARRTFERQYATVEITDSVATMAGHQVGLMRGYHSQLDQAVRALEDDVVSRAAGYHDMTAILDKIAAGELLGRRQDMATNQLLSHTLEQLLARSKRLRDTEASTLNMQLVTWRDSQAANEAFVSGTGDALRTWRQP